MKTRSLLRTRGGMLAFGSLAFGTGMIVITQHTIPRMWDISFPGTVIPIMACYLVGLCWSEAMWQLMRKARFLGRNENDV